MKIKKISLSINKLLYLHLCDNNYYILMTNKQYVKIKNMLK